MCVDLELYRITLPSRQPHSNYAADAAAAACSRVQHVSVCLHIYIYIYICYTCYERSVAHAVRSGVFRLCPGRSVGRLMGLVVLVGIGLTIWLDCVCACV